MKISTYTVTHIGVLKSSLTKSKLGFLNPLQQPGSYWNRSSALSLVGRWTHRGDSLWLDTKLANHKSHGESYNYIWSLYEASRHRVRNQKFARNLKFATSKTLVNLMKKIMFCLKIGIFSVQKAVTYCTFNKSHLNLFILLAFPHVANFRYVANFRFLTLHT